MHNREFPIRQPVFSPEKESGAPQTHLEQMAATIPEFQTKNHAPVFFTEIFPLNTEIVVYTYADLEKELAAFLDRNPKIPRRKGGRMGMARFDNLYPKVHPHAKQYDLLEACYQLIRTQGYDFVNENILSHMDRSARSKLISWVRLRETINALVARGEPYSGDDIEEEFFKRYDQKFSLGYFQAFTNTRSFMFGISLKNKPRALRSPRIKQPPSEEPLLRYKRVYAECILEVLRNGTEPKNFIEMLLPYLNGRKEIVLPRQNTAIIVKNFLKLPVNQDYIREQIHLHYKKQTFVPLLNACFKSLS